MFSLVAGRDNNMQTLTRFEMRQAAAAQGFDMDENIGRGAVGDGDKAIAFGAVEPVDDRSLHQAAFGRRRWLLQGVIRVWGTFGNINGQYPFDLQSVLAAEHLAANDRAFGDVAEAGPAQALLMQKDIAHLFGMNESVP